MNAAAPAPIGVRLARDDAARAQRVRQFLLGSVAVLLVMQWVPRGLEFAAPALWLLQFVLIARLDVLREGALVRAMTSLLLGFALAWLTLAAFVLDFREHYALFLHWNPTGVPGCQVSALLGFPIRAIAGHGGGGWRLFHHLPSDPLVHTANVLLLALPCWLLLGWVGARARIVAYWFAFAALPLAWLCGLRRAMYWWD